jgi:hypothetical protein
MLKLDKLLKEMVNITLINGLNGVSVSDKIKLANIVLLNELDKLTELEKHEYDKIYKCVNYNKIKDRKEYKNDEPKRSKLGEQENKFGQIIGQKYNMKRVELYNFVYLFLNNSGISLQLIINLILKKNKILCKDDLLTFAYKYLNVNIDKLVLFFDINYISNSKMVCLLEYKISTVSEDQNSKNNMDDEFVVKLVNCVINSYWLKFVNENKRNADNKAEEIVKKINILFKTENNNENKLINKMKKILRKNKNNYSTMSIIMVMLKNYKNIIKNCLFKKFVDYTAKILIKNLIDIYCEEF